MKPDNEGDNTTSAEPLDPENSTNTNMPQRDDEAEAAVEALMGPPPEPETSDDTIPLRLGIPPQQAEAPRPQPTQQAVETTDIGKHPDSKEPQEEPYNNLDAIIAKQLNAPEHIATIPSAKRRFWSRRRILIGSICSLFALVVFVGLWFAMTSPTTPDGRSKLTFHAPSLDRLKDNVASINAAPPKTYNTPIGWLPPFQDGTAKNGKFKITAYYAPDQSYTREGNFFVEGENISFEMLPDITKVNRLIKTIYDRENQPFNEAINGATRNFSYDYASLIGYSNLYFTVEQGAFLPMIPLVEAALKNPGNEEAKYVTPTAACSAALTALKEKTSPAALTTITASQKPIKEKDAYTVVTNSIKLKDIDTALYNFFGNCFDPKDPLYGDYAKSAQKQPSRQMTTEYSEKDGRWNLRIKESDIRFELWDINKVDTVKQGATASSTTIRNNYGLIYSVCRVVPVALPAIGHQYEFLVEDSDYDIPGQLDSGYRCATTDAPKEYRPPSSMSLQYSGGAEGYATSPESVDSLRAIHDASYHIEQYNLTHKRFPSGTEFTQAIRPKLGEIQDTLDLLISEKIFEYKPLPAGCATNCNDYAVSLHIDGSSLSHGAYISAR